MLFIIASFISNLIAQELIISKDVYLKTDEQEVHITKGERVKLSKTRYNEWLELFEKNKKKGFLSKDCADFNDNAIRLKKECPMYSESNNNSKIVKILAKDELYTLFNIKRVPECCITYKSKELCLDVETLKFENPLNVDSEFYQQISIDDILKIKGSDIFVSQFIDKTMYYAGNSGVYSSFNGKQWFKLKKLEPRQYAIAITDEGWLLADNLISKDFGKTFLEFFPNYAFPGSDYNVKSVIYSPGGMGTVYLTFYKKNDDSNLVVFVLNEFAKGWKKVYPIASNQVDEIPQEDTTTAVLRFVNEWLDSKKFELDNIGIQSFGNKVVAALVLRESSNKKNDRFYTVLKLEFAYTGGWKLLDEKWRAIL